MAAACLPAAVPPAVPAARACAAVAAVPAAFPAAFPAAEIGHPWLLRLLLGQQAKGRLLVDITGLREEACHREFLGRPLVNLTEHYYN